MSGAIHPLPQYAFMAWCLVKYRDNFTFCLEPIKEILDGNNREAERDYLLV
jgi:hypothetical protein